MKILRLGGVALVLMSAFEFFSTKAFAANMNLDQYIEQVRNKNQAYQGAQLRSQGAKERVGEAGLLTSPNLFWNSQWAMDEAQKMNPSAQGTKGFYQTHQLGVSQQFGFGLTSRLYYNLNYTSLTNVSSAFVPYPSVYEGKPVIELSMPLWRNWLGSELRGNQEAIKAQAEAAQYSESFTSKIVIAEAEGAYWRLALARQNKKLQTESLERSQKLRDWSARRAREGLGDRSDQLQAEGAWKLRSLETQSAIDEERQAALMFNSVRGINSDKVSEELEGLPDSKNYKFVLPQRGQLRDDVKAAQASAQASAAVAEAGVEKNKPNLEVYTSLAYNGRDVQYPDAIKNSTKSDYPTTAIGVRFMMPLDLGTLSDNRDGYRKEAAGSELRYQRRLFEQERDWNDLEQKFKEATERLKLAESFEEIQREKSQYERAKHNRGRTTTYMVLQFEQDYALAQSTRLRIQAEIMNLIAQMKTYSNVSSDFQSTVVPLKHEELQARGGTL
ncbi:MAG: TolC family protein [Bdellovibrionales bacterium]